MARWMTIGMMLTMLLGCTPVNRTEEATQLVQRLGIPADSVRLVRRCIVQVAAKGTFKVVGGGDAVCYVTRAGFHLRWRGSGPEIPRELVSLSRSDVESIALYDGVFPSQLQFMLEHQWLSVMIVPDSGFGADSPATIEAFNLLRNDGYAETPTPGRLVGDSPPMPILPMMR